MSIGGGVGGVGREPIDTGEEQLEGANEGAAASAAQATRAAAGLKLESLTTERIASMTVKDRGEVDVSVGFGGGFTARGGRVGLKVEGREYTVETRQGDDTVAKLDELRKKMEAAGYGVTVTRRPAIDTYSATWKIVKAAAPPRPREPGRGPLGIRSLTTEANAKARVTDTGAAFFTHDVNKSLQGGRIGLEIEGKKLTVRTRAGDRLDEKLDDLKQKIEAAGYEVKEKETPLIVGSQFEWTIAKKAAGLKLESLTTERIASMTVKDGGEVDVGVGFGGGFSAYGGRVGLKVEGREHTVETRQGDNAVAKLDELRKKLEDSGYKVTVTRRPAIDTYWATWKVEKAGPRPPAPAPGGVQDLGVLGEPGTTLGGKTYTLKPGETLRFETNENQITGMGDFAVDPAGALTIERKVIRERTPGMLGGSTGYEWRITVPAGAQAGTTAKLTSAPNFQVRNDPRWKFDLEVKVG